MFALKDCISGKITSEAIVSIEQSEKLRSRTAATTAAVMWSSSSVVLLVLSLPLLYVASPKIFAPKTLPPIPAADDSDDLALFRRATLASASQRLHPPPPKIAFLFLTNSDLAFAPLWERFFAGHHSLLNVYVHADPSSSLLSPPTPSFCRRFIHSKPTRRASPTLIAAARRLLSAALIDDPSNAFFALLSSRCVPLHSFPYLYRTLTRNSSRSFIEILSGEPGIRDRYLARGDRVMLPEVPFQEFRVGSQFFVLARHHAALVVKDRKLWRKFGKPCLKSMEDSCYPEEHYFPTLLSMQDRSGCSGYTLTRVNWTGSVGGHPHTYMPGEISGRLIRELRRSNSTYEHLFARKFSPDCLKPLLKIAKSVIFRD